MQRRTVSERAECRLRHGQHLGRWIDSVETPTGLGLGEHLDLEAAACTENENACVVRGALRYEQHDHALHIGEAGHETRGRLRVARDCVRIKERVHADGTVP
jgi:hypothetical protein